MPILLDAIATIHGANGFFYSNPNGGWEFAGFWAVALLVQAGLGNGAFALEDTLGRDTRPAAMSAA